MTQLPLALDAPRYLPLAEYDRLPVGAQTPLTSGEIAALAHHGYRLLGAEDGFTHLDTPDGPQWCDNDWWRSELDIYYLQARNLDAAGDDAAPRV